MDDKDDSYDGKFNPNFIIIQLQLQLHLFIYFLFSFFLLPIKTYSGGKILPFDKQIQKRMTIMMMICGCQSMVSIGSICYLSMNSLFPLLSFLLYYSTFLSLVVPTPIYNIHRHKICQQQKGGGIRGCKYCIS